MIMGFRKTRTPRPGRALMGWLIGLLTLVVVAICVLVWGYLSGYFESRQSLDSSSAPVSTSSTSSGAGSSVCNMGLSAKKSLDEGIVWRPVSTGTDIGYVSGVGPGLVSETGAPRCFAHSKAGMALAAINIWQAWDTSARPDVVKNSVSGPEFEKMRDLTEGFDKSKLKALSARGGTKVFAYRVSSYGPLSGSVELMSSTPSGIIVWSKMPMEFTQGDWHWRMIFNSDHIGVVDKLNLEDSWKYVREGDFD